MAKNEENNSHLMLKNNSTQNINSYKHHKNKSSNFLTDSPSTLFTVQLHSLNSNQNTKNNNNNVEKNNTNNNYSTSNLSIKNNTKNIKDTSTNTQKILNQKYYINPSQDNNNANNIRIKLSKISSQFSASTPKQIASLYNQMCGGELEPGNILVKKNLKLNVSSQKKLINYNNNNNNKKDLNLNKNSKSKNKKNNNGDFVKYVNNDKSNFNTNFFNLTQNYTKCFLSQSKSFIKNDKNNDNSLSSGINTPNNKNINNTNIKKNNKNNFNYIYYNNNKNSNSKKENNIDNNNNTNDNNNIEENKKIYFMKPVQKRKKCYNNNYNKSNETSNINTYQSSINSRDRKDNDNCNKNIFENNNNILNDLFDKNVNNPEELHFFYVKILQSGNEVCKKFEIE